MISRFRGTAAIPVVAMAIALALSACGTPSAAPSRSTDQTLPTTVAFGSARQADIEQSLSAAHFNLCEKLDLPIPNQGYKYLTTTSYYLLDGACPPPPLGSVDSIPGLVDLSVDTYQTPALELQGSTVYRDEVVNGTHFTTAAWTYGQFLVSVLHTASVADVNRLAGTMKGLGARLLFRH